MYQDQEKIFTIRTLACDICERYDSLLLTREELESKVFNNSLHIGSKILSHGDHLRIVYFDEEGTYLGDTMSLNVSSDKLSNPEKLDIPYLIKGQDTSSISIHRKMLKLFTKIKHTITIVGPSMAGKTSLTLFLNTGIPERQSHRINHPATMGKSIKRFDLSKNKLTVLDLGGQRDFWPMWKENISMADKIIFMLDGTANNVKETRDALDLLISHIRPEQDLLILFNKLDLYLEGYSQSFVSADKMLSGFTPPEGLQYWILESSVFNGIVYNYSATHEESPLSSAVIDFLNR